MFDAVRSSSDGGLALLAAAANRIGIIAAIASCVRDRREASRVVHTHQRLLTQRVMAIAAGDSDCTDHSDLRVDPMLQLATGDRDLDLASQPTLHRFEHRPSTREVIGMTRRFESFVIDRLAERPPQARLVIIVLDGTLDPAYGQQDFSSFNGHHGTGCLFPLLGFLTIDGEVEQHLFHARLQPGTAREQRVSVALLRRTVGRLRKAFQGAELVVRLDAGFAAPHLLKVLDELEVKYMVGALGNKVLARMAAGRLEYAR